MIYFDVTKSGASGHRSGLTRVNERLRRELGDAAVAVRWRAGDKGRLELPDGRPADPGRADWFLTTELFSEAERPGFSGFIDAHGCRTAGLFHDAIPLRFPHITWPRSVERHPGYMKALARFDRVFAVSAASAADLAGFWRWQGVDGAPAVGVLPLGADFDGTPRVSSPREDAAAQARAALLCVGILEPRKNQLFLVEVCRVLWREGLEFDLHVVGRTNPHFGKEIADGIRRLAGRCPGLHFHGAASDSALAALYAGASAAVMPTIAEGCGLPLLESLWRGVPCVCSDLPALRENAIGGGCLIVPANDGTAWQSALRNVIARGVEYRALQSAARSRPLPTWSAAAGRLLGELR